MTDAVDQLRGIAHQIGSEYQVTSNRLMDLLLGNVEDDLASRSLQKWVDYLLNCGPTGCSNMGSLKGLNLLISWCYEVCERECV